MSKAAVSPVPTLTSLAGDYAKGMTSIRGRRVQRLLRREFAGAESVFVVQVDGARPAVVGLSSSGAAFCATDGRGRQVTVVKWLHGSTHAIETAFDLLKDSLPVLGDTSVPLAASVREALAQVSPSSVAPEARGLLAMALQLPSRSPA